MSNSIIFNGVNPFASPGGGPVAPTPFTVPTKITLWANEALAQANGTTAVEKSLLFQGVSKVRPTPWEIIGYPGATAIRAKFMSVRPRQYIVFGAIAGGNEAVMKDASNLILSMNCGAWYYTITTGTGLTPPEVGPLFAHDGVGVIIEDIVFAACGMGSGAIWPFEIHCRDLATTSIS